MTLGAHAWLATTLTERAKFWRLSADQFRVAITLVAVARISDGAPRVVTSSSELERYFGMARGKIRRVLDALEAAGFCRVWTAKGRGGITSIALLDPRPFEMQLSLPISPIIQSDVQDAEMVCESLADHGDRGHLIDHLDSDEKAQMIGGGRARDQDLQRSPSDPPLRSDLRSSSSRDLTSKEIQISPLEKMAAWLETSEGDPPAKAVRKRIDADAIPDRAFAAADYLRGRVLNENKAAFVGRRPWDGKAGLRLDWANGFRVLHRHVVEAMKNADAAVGDAEAWAEIAKTVKWIFTGQSTKARFIVESPDAVREKWDRIQAVRRNNRAKSDEESKPKRGDGRPDPMAARELQRWTLPDA